MISASRRDYYKRYRLDNLEREKVRVSEWREKNQGKLCNWCYKKGRTVGAYCSKRCQHKKRLANAIYFAKRKRKMI